MPSHEERSLLTSFRPKMLVNFESFAPKDGQRVFSLASMEYTMWPPWDLMLEGSQVQKVMLKQRRVNIIGGHNLPRKKNTSAPKWEGLDLSRLVIHFRSFPPTFSSFHPPFKCPLRMAPLELPGRLTNATFWEIPNVEGLGFENWGKPCQHVQAFCQGNL